MSEEIGVHFKAKYKFPDIDDTRLFESDMLFDSQESLDLALSDKKALFGIIAENSCLGMVYEMEFVDGEVIRIVVFDNENAYQFAVTVSQVWDANVI